MVAKNIEDNIKRILKKRNLKADRRLVVFLFFVFLSTVFWFLNQLEEEYVANISLPVRYTNFPEDKILINDLPNHFDLRVRAYGYKIMEYKISNKFLPYKLNLNSLTLRLYSKSSDVKFFSLTRLLKDNIEKQLSSELEIISISPDTLYFDFADKIFKKVPVEPRLEVTPANQYMIRGGIKLDPDSITISGASPILDTINKVFTKHLELKELESDYKNEIELMKINEVDFSSKKVGVYINVEKFTEGSQTVKLKIINVPDSLILRTFPKEITVSYFVALSDYEKVSSQLFEAVVNYNEISIQENTLKVEVVNSPDFIQSLRYNPESVEYIIEKK